MDIIKTVEEFRVFRDSGFFKNKQIGFVPTMGALHEGHLSLMKRSLSENDITIVSIYVNPKQFNDKTDYMNYPVNIERDIDLLRSVGCDILFLPFNEDIYKDYDGYKMDFKGLDEIYEGEFRPGHFQGVVDIVYRLFDIVKPDRAYFGEKDFQQVAVIKQMVRESGLQVKIVPCPIIREKSGLAMSSRNERLDPEEKVKAAEIYRIINKVKEKVTIKDNPAALIAEITNEIDEVKFLKTEYVIFCEPDTLTPVEFFKEGASVILCLAVWCEKVRLIDNISLQF